MFDKHKKGIIADPFINYRLNYRELKRPFPTAELTSFICTYWSDAFLCHVTPAAWGLIVYANILKIN